MPDVSDMIAGLLGVRRAPWDDPISGVTQPSAMPNGLPYPHDVPQGVDLTPRPDEMRTYTPSLQEHVKNLLQDAMMAGGAAPYPAGHIAGGISSLSGLVPPIGAVYAADEARHANSLPSAAAAALGVIPAGGKVAKAAEEAGAALSKRAAAITANNLRDMAPEEAMNIASSNAHIIPKTEGGFVGAPSWVQKPKDLATMRNNFDAQVEEGLTGSNWYSRAQQGIKDIAGSDPARQHLLSQELAQTSAQATPDTNLGFGLQMHNAYEAGTPLDISRTRQIAQSYKAAREAGTDIPLGKKTSVYAGHLDPTIENPNTGTNDIWHARAFGYQDPTTGEPWHSALTPQQHSFMDAETLLAVKRANEKQLAGRNNWTPGEIQAAPWVALKSKGLQEQFGWDKARADAEAAKTYPDFFNKYTAHGTYEATPGIGTGHLQGVATGPADLRAKFSADPRSSWMNNEGHDILYNTLGMYQRPTVPSTGVYQSPGGPLEINPANVARPLVGMTGAAGERVVDPASRSLMNTAEATRAYMDAQNAGAWSKAIMSNKPSALNSISFEHNQPMSVDQISQLRSMGAQHGLPDVIDYGKGGVLTNFGGGQDIKGIVRALKGGQIGSDLGKIVPGAVPQRAQMESGYLGYEDALRAPQGSGAATRQLRENIPNETVLNKLDASPDVRQAAMDRFDRDAEYAAQGGGVAREDIQRARSIIAREGFSGLFKALDRGVALPAVLLPIAAGAVAAHGQRE